MSSFVIVDKSTGEAVFETFKKETADKVREKCAATHEVVPIHEYLAGLNKRQNPGR